MNELVCNLVDKDIDGVLANVRPLADEPMVRRLKRATRIVRERLSGTKEAWLYLYWTPEARADGSTDCGYSGWLEASQENNPVTITILDNK